MDKPPLVCDTSLLLYLGRIDYTHLLPILFEPVYVPEIVVLELDVGRTVRPDTINPRFLGWLVPVAVDQAEVDVLPANRLGRGERAVIAYARSHTGCVAGLDDRQARLLADQLGLPVVGTVGVLVKGKKLGLIQSVQALLEEMQAKGFRISRDLYSESLRLANESADDH